jgi:hypothetical protein
MVTYIITLTQTCNEKKYIKRPKYFWQQWIKWLASINACVILLCIKDKKIPKYPQMTLLDFFFCSYKYFGYFIIYKTLNK